MHGDSNPIKRGYACKYEDRLSLNTRPLLPPPLLNAVENIPRCVYGLKDVHLSPKVHNVDQFNRSISCIPTVTYYLWEIRRLDTPQIQFIELSIHNDVWDLYYCCNKILIRN